MRMSRLLGAAVASLLAVGCSADPSGAGARVEPDEARRPVAPGREVIFRGACDASGTVPLSAQHFVVADDEDNILRVYDADAGGEPLSQTDLSAALGLPLEGKQRPKAAELDLEAATTVGERAYWLTSHGRNKKGKLAPARLHFFATSTFVDERGDTLQLVGHPYDRLVDDLAAAPHLTGFGLADAAQRAPKAEGGLNIEGLTAAPDGPMLLGFRNPVPQGRALVVPLLNPAALVDAPDGGPARFGAPILLDLGQRGVRSLSWWRGRYLLIAGHHAEGGSSTLFTWDGSGAPAATAIDLSGYNPEGFFTPEDRDEILVVSDDGERLVDGTPCKKLKAPARKQFRGVWLALP